MKVSILVPVYGAEQYIADCCRSLFGQTYEDIEYIFVNDCTKDRSMEVIKETLAEYPERRQQVSIVSNERNMGVGAARQRCINEAGGDYLMFVDADDTITDNAVELLLRAVTGAGADIATAAHAETCKGDIMRVYHTRHYDRVSLMRGLLLQNTVAHQLTARIYRRAFITASGIRFAEGIDNAEDYCFTSRIFLHAKYVTIDDVVYYHRTDTCGVYTTFSRKNVTSLLKANAVVCRFFTDNDKERKYYSALHIGMLKPLIVAMKNGFGYDEAVEICGYGTDIPPAVSLCHLLLRRFGAVRTVNILYLMIKRIYRTLRT